VKTIIDFQNTFIIKKKQHYRNVFNEPVFTYDVLPDMFRAVLGHHPRRHSHTKLEITAGLTYLSHNSLRAQRCDFINLHCKLVQGTMNNVSDCKTPSNSE